MAKRTPEQLKAFFRRGLHPTEGQFADLIDSFVHKDGTIPASQVERLTEQLNDKYTQSEGRALEKELSQLQSAVKDNSRDLDQLAIDIASARKEDERFFLSYLTVVPFDGFLADYEQQKDDLEYGIFFFRSGERPDGDEKPGFELFAISNALFADSSFFDDRYYSLSIGVPRNSVLYLNNRDGCLYRFDGQDLVKAYISPDEMKAISIDEINSTLTF